MLRISLHSSPAAETLVLEGELKGDWVAELRRVVAAARPRSPRLELDLAQVRYASAEGAALIRELCASGVGVVRTSSFMDTLLRSSQP